MIMAFNPIATQALAAVARATGHEPPPARPAKDPEFMTASEINKELDKLDARSSKNTDDFIAAGRGHERPSEYLRQADPLSMEARRISDRQSSLRIEIERRYGPRAPSRLPSRGFGPRRAA